MRGLNIGKQSKEFTEIDEETQKELLNTSPPSTNKGGDSLVLPKSKDSTTEVIEPVTEPTEEVVSKEPDFTIEDPSTPTEIDFDLPAEEFSKLYIDDRGNKSTPYNPNNFKTHNSSPYGKGVEDYRDYIDNPIKGENLDYVRAVSQSGWEQAGRAGIRFAANVLPETIQQGANMLEGLFNVGVSREGAGNPISELMEDIKQSTNANFDIYLEKPDEQMAVGDSGWWADRGSSLATSATAFVALGYATGGVALGSRMTNLIGKGGKGGKELAGLLKNEIAAGSKLSEIVKNVSLGKKGVNYATIGDGVFNSYLMTTAESIGVSTEVYHDVFDTELERLKREGLNEEQAKIEAGKQALKAGDRAFMFNQWNIALNVTSVMPFLRAKNLTGGLTKRTLLGGAKKIGLEGVQESTEELVNLVSEKRATDLDYNFEKAVGDIFTKEGAESAFLGFIGGFAQTGLTLSGQYIKTDGKSNNQRHKEQLAAQEESRSFHDDLSTGAKGNAWDLYKTTSDQTKIVNKVNKLSNDYQKADTKEEREKISAELDAIELNMFSKQAYNAFKMGTGDSFIESLEGVMKLTDEEADKQGFDISEDNNYRDKITNRLTDLKELKEIFDYTNNLYQGDRAYTTAANAYFFKALKEGYREKLQGEESEYLSNLQEAMDSGGKGVFTLGIRDGEVTRELTDESAKIREDSDKAVEKNNRELDVLKGKLDKAKDRLKLANQNKETVKAVQLGILEKEVKTLEKQIEEKEQERQENATDGEAIEHYQILDDNLLAELKENLPTSKTFETLKFNFQEARKEEERSQAAFDALVSIKGQKKAKADYISSRLALEERVAENKAKAKQKAKTEKRKAEEAKKKEEEIIEEVVEEVVEETKEAPPEVDIYSRYTPLVTSTTDEVSIDQTIATLQLTKEEIEDTGGTIEPIVFKIFKSVNSNSKRQKLLIGLLQKTYLDPNPIVDQKITDLYNAIERYESSIAKHSEPFTTEQLRSLPDQFRKDLELLLSEEVDTSEALHNIDDLDMDVDGLENEDDGEASLAAADLLAQRPEDANKFGKWIDKVLDKRGLTIDSKMTDILNIVISEVGEQMARKVFYKLQGYKIYKTEKRDAQFFNTIQKKIGEEKEQRKEERKQLEATEIEHYDEAPFLVLEAENIKNTRAEILMAEGVVLDENTEFSDNYHKSESISDKLAFKSVESIRKGEDLNSVTIIGNKKLTDVDNKVLTESGIKIGDVVTFKPLTYFKDNEDVEYFINRNDEGELFLEKQIPGVPERISASIVDNAPIQVSINDAPLRDVYLHLPSFITSEHMPYSKARADEFKRRVEAGENVNELIEKDIDSKISEAEMQQEVDNLRSLRKRIIEGEDIVAKISDRGNGFYMEASIQDVAVNLPNVRLAIYDGTSFISDKGTVIQADFKGENGRVYAMIPAGRGNDVSYTPYSISKKRLTEDQITLVSDIYRLKLIDTLTKEDEALVKYYKKNGFNLRDNSFKGFLDFKALLKTFINVRTAQKDKNSTESIEEYDNPTFFMRYDEDTKKPIVFAGKKNNIIINFDINGDSKELLNKVEALKELLVGATVNIAKHRLGENFFLPSINIGETGENTKTSYNSFVKDNTETNIKSIKVDGEDVYRIQRSIYFDEEQASVEREANLKTAQEEQNNAQRASKENTTKQNEKEEAIKDNPITEPTEDDDFLLEEDFEEFGDIHNLDDFGVAEASNIEETVDTLLEEGKIKGTEEDGKSCKLKIK